MFVDDEKEMLLSLKEGLKKFGNTFSVVLAENMAGKSSALMYIEKLFLINTLAKQIITALRKESNSGTLHSISSSIFLQLIEMEERTCTIRLSDKKSGRQGMLLDRNMPEMDFGIT